jgi:hypothetical protein
MKLSPARWDRGKLYGQTQIPWNQQQCRHSQGNTLGNWVVLYSIHQLTMESLIAVFFIKKSSFSFPQFCDIADGAIIHKKI